MSLYLIRYIFYFTWALAFLAASLVPYDTVKAFFDGLTTDGSFDIIKGATYLFLRLYLFLTGVFPVAVCFGKLDITALRWFRQISIV
tara:strand:- start:79 stop:339 length:261 start_codon:yes stop_codon:yes gene_type:complete